MTLLDSGTRFLVLVIVLVIILVPVLVLISFLILILLTFLRLQSLALDCPTLIIALSIPRKCSATYLPGITQREL